MSDSDVNVLFVGTLEGGYFLLGCGVEKGESLLSGGVDELSVEEEACWSKMMAVSGRNVEEAGGPAPSSLLEMGDRGWWSKRGVKRVAYGFQCLTWRG